MKKIGVGIIAFFGSIFSAFAEEAEGNTPVFDCPEGACGADAGLEKVGGSLGGSGIITGDGEASLIDVILAVVNVALTILGTIAFVAFVWAGALYIFAFLNEENAETAKKVMIWTAIGIIIILLSYSLTSFLITLNG